MLKSLPWTRDDESRGRHTGTFGEVHVWKRLKNGVKETAVIKIPTVPQHIEKLKQERDKMIKVNHINIVKCLSPQIFSDDFDINKHYRSSILWRDVLVMEYCDAGNLRKVFNRNKQGIGLSEIKNLCNDLGSALKYLHEVHHIIHRDIKPENVFLTTAKDYHPKRSHLYKLGDLGEVTEVMKSDGMTHISTLQTHGTFAYMAPEQLLYDPYDGTMKMGESADLWGFGTILSEASFGLRPFFHNHGHHIHTDINSYCSNLLKKSDEVIFIYKEGSLQDRVYPPRHQNTIPNNGTLPGIIIDMIYKVLKSCLRADRKLRGDKDGSSGHYKVYDDIEYLASVDLCCLLNICDLSFQYFVKSENLKFQMKEHNKEFVLHESLTISSDLSLKSGFQILLGGENLLLHAPKIPVVLEQYFSEPFPSNKRLVERSLLGYVVKIKAYLLNLTEGVDVELAYLNSYGVTSLVSSLVSLKKEMLEFKAYLDTWCEIFTGLTSSYEWTDVYILIDNLRDKYLQSANQFSDLSCSLYKLIGQSPHAPEGSSREGAMTSSTVSNILSNRTTSCNKQTLQLLQENAKLVYELENALKEAM